MSDNRTNNRRWWWLVAVLALVVITAGLLVVWQPWSRPFQPSRQYLATIETDKGNIVIELYADTAPKTVENFVKLARQGFYDGLTFHRVVPGFVIQGGDPKGDGTGGPGYTIEAEISSLSHITGTVAMARRPDEVNPERRSSGSQFYICLAPQPHLDGQYTIFGQVVEGMDTVLRITPGDVMRRVTITER
ncbi:MAG: peptidylprolyl isomerase [Anaerolineae bacterium]